MATSALAQLSGKANGAKLLSVGFSVARMGDEITVVPQVSLQQANPQMQQYFVGGLMPLCVQIKDYLERNLELYPTMVNSDNVDYSNGIAISVAVPFTNPQMIATR